MQEMAFHTKEGIECSKSWRCKSKDLKFSTTDGRPWSRCWLFQVKGRFCLNVNFLYNLLKFGFICCNCSEFLRFMLFHGGFFKDRIWPHHSRGNETQRGLSNSYCSEAELEPKLKSRVFSMMKASRLSPRLITHFQPFRVRRLRKRMV